MTNSTFYDLQDNSKAVLAQWNVGVGTGNPFDFADREVQSALNAANTALLSLGAAIERAQARHTIEVATEKIKQAEAILTNVTAEPTASEPTLLVCKHCPEFIAITPQSADYVHVSGVQAGKHTCAVDPYGFHAEPLGSPCSNHPANPCNGARGLTPTG